MDHNELTNDEEEQLSISYELLTLMHWLVARNPGLLKQMVDRAFDNGLREELRHMASHADSVNSDDVHDIVVEFFGYIEMLMNEKSDKQARCAARAKKLAPTIDRIDTATCSDDTVLASLKKATSQLERNPKANGKELFMKELLRRWQPTNKKVLH